MIHAELIGKEHLVPFVRTIGGNIKTELEKSITRLAFKLSREVKQRKLSGQVLKNRTGTLRRSINQRVEVTPTSITGIVGTNKEYAAVHEYGFNGTVTVHEHMRQIKQAFGKSLKGGGMAVMVRSHPRHMVLPERSFLRSALREMQTDISTEIQSALKRAVKP